MDTWRAFAWYCVVGVVLGLVFAAIGWLTR